MENRNQWRDSGRERPAQEAWKFDGVEYSNEWIKTRIDGDAVKWANKFAEDVLVNKQEDKGKHGISPSHFRSIYGEIKRIQLKGFEQEKPAFHLLRPKVAYAVKRQETKGSKRFKDLLEKMHGAVEADKPGAEERYRNFCDLIEALLAFHKAHGGKN
jgi:CRISPR-associated protein Csm2